MRLSQNIGFVDILMQGFLCLCFPYVYGYRLFGGRDNQDDDLHLACSQLD
jgi:hypothetical protein